MIAIFNSTVQVEKTVLQIHSIIIIIEASKSWGPCNLIFDNDTQKSL